MPSKLYILRIQNGTRAVTPETALEALDFDRPDAVKDLLRRHLLAAAERDGKSRSEAHLYYLAVHERHRDGRPVNTAMAYFVLPVEL